MATKSMKRLRILDISLIAFTVLFVIFTVCITSFFLHKSKTEQQKEETFGFNTTGNENIYVKDGVIISLKNIYYKDEYIALQVKASSSKNIPVTVTAGIEIIDKSLSFTTDTESYYYLMVENRIVGSFDLDIEIKSEEKILAKGILTVVPQKENATVLKESEIILFTEDIKMLFLGKDSNSAFFLLKNNTNEPKKVKLSTRTYSYEIIAPQSTEHYVYAHGLGLIDVGMDSFDVKVE